MQFTVRGKQRQARLTEGIPNAKRHSLLQSMDTVSFKFHLGKLCRHKQVTETSWKMNNKSGDLMNSCMFSVGFQLIFI